MSSELENQIQEDLAKDKFLLLLSKFKKTIIIVVILIISIPSCYQVYVSYNIKKNENLLSDYSHAMLVLKTKGPDQSINLFEKILQNNFNQKIKLLSFNRLLEIYLENKNTQKIIELFNYIISNDINSNNYIELIKLKKSLVIFDTASEKEMLELLNTKNKKNIYRNMSIQILADFYMSRNNFKKYQEFINDIK